MTWRYPGPDPVLAGRELLATPLQAFHDAACREAGPAPSGWTVDLGGNLLFDAAGLSLLAAALAGYRGDAAVLEFDLEMARECWRDYYSLQPEGCADGLRLPIRAIRGSGTGSAGLRVRLPTARHRVPLPVSMGGAEVIEVPRALLLPCHQLHDLLFAQQIGLVSRLEARTRASPAAWLRGACMAGTRGPFAQRAALGYRSIAPGADVHPTAVIEGSEIGTETRVGAHAVVRFSVVGRGARLHDGAKVELSVVGDGTWLMHDLVLYRSATESGVFLIHGPYQFSAFLAGSSAFATILMDYRADGRPIRVAGPGGPRDYAGRLLGSVVGPGAKILGGCMVAPGRSVPAGTWLAPDPGQVHVLSAPDFPGGTALPPASTRRPDP